RRGAGEPGVDIGGGAENPRPPPPPPPGGIEKPPPPPPPPPPWGIEKPPPPPPPPPPPRCRCWALAPVTTAVEVRKIIARVPALAAVFGRMAFGLHVAPHP